MYCALLCSPPHLKLMAHAGLAASTTHLKYTPVSSTSNCVGGLWASGAEEEAASRQLSTSTVR